MNKYQDLIRQRDATLRADVLASEGVAFNPERTMVRDRWGDWYSVAWSSHLNRYECQAAHVDDVLRRATQ